MMKVTFSAVGICALLLNPASTLAVDNTDNVRIKNLMSAAQYKAAGIHKLTPEERESLNRWLRSYADNKLPIVTSDPQPNELEAAGSTLSDAKSEIAEEADHAVPDKNFGLSRPIEEPAEPVILNAKVLPPFRGWSGKSVFKLDNGQVWRQRVSGRFTYTGDDYRVAIGKSRWGFFEMRLLAADRSVGVSRVK